MMVGETGWWMRANATTRNQRLQSPQHDAMWAVVCCWVGTVDGRPDTPIVPTKSRAEKYGIMVSRADKAWFSGQSSWFHAGFLLADHHDDDNSSKDDNDDDDENNDDDIKTDDMIINLW